jgi:hypothetical protein
LEKYNKENHQNQENQENHQNHQNQENQENQNNNNNERSCWYTFFCQIINAFSRLIKYILEFVGCHKHLREI